MKTFIRFIMVLAMATAAAPVLAQIALLKAQQTVK